MIVTVTMNPALDKTAELPKLVPGALNRIASVRLDPGGKGVNVSRVIRELGGESVCTGFAGGDAGKTLVRLLTQSGLRSDFLPVDGVTRTNLKVVEPDGTLTELNEPGLAVTGDALDALLARVRRLAGKNGIAVLSGSLPKNADPGVYRDFARALAEAGCRVLLDADGEAFRLALEAAPALVKPNRFELLQAFGLPQTTPDGRLPELCGKLVERGVGFVILSLGADGAMFFTKDESLRAAGLRVPVRSTVGAGDSMVGAAAFALERGLPLRDLARLAMAASAGAVTTEGTNPPSLELVRELEEKIVLIPLA